MILVFFLGSLFGVVVCAAAMLCVFTGQYHRLALWHFFDAAGLTTSSDNFVQFEGNPHRNKIRPRLRNLKMVDGCFEFDLYPALGKNLSAYIEKTEEMAQALHAASVTIEPRGVGDYGHTVVYFSDPIPQKFSIADLDSHE